MLIAYTYLLSNQKDKLLEVSCLT